MPIIPPDLNAIVRRLLLSAPSNPPLRLVRSRGSRWGFQEVDLALGAARLQLFFDKGYYEVRFAAVNDTEWYSPNEVLPRIGNALPPLVGRNAEEVVRDLAQVLARYSGRIASMFSEPEYADLRRSVIAERKARYS